ncbi:hypothetical protein HL667_27160 [Bradyrhizobium sp. 83012]|uniref:DUF1176 domain-containing protein n=1 Tax=Bradyrhizobium aeschynomenes TaxID=2734909 RepID=A0ABX2CMY4_9BRAD|nr:hypothetical protein [Bradyrhizobium aeschynomenes]NPU68709.1 hypothetical protein [Bradyrhizobium aeschynomenes]
MRRLLVARFMITALCLITAAAVAPAHGDDEASHIVKLENRDFDGINFKGQTEFEIHDPDLLPKQVVRAIEQTGCRYKSELKSRPVRFLAIQRGRFAIVPCFAMVGRTQMFDLADLRRPQLQLFAIAALDRGFITAPEPGVIGWNSKKNVFEVEIRSDLCGDPASRYIYRLSQYDSGPSLVRTDVRKDGCRQDEGWATIWEAPAWPKREDLR